MRNKAEEISGKERMTASGGPGSDMTRTHLPEDFVHMNICDLCKCVYIDTPIATGL